MKKIAFMCICILVGFSLTNCGFLRELLYVYNEPYSVTNEDIAVGFAPDLTANAYQHNAHVSMFSVGGKVYYYIGCWPGSFGERSKFDGKICRIEGGEIVPILDVDGCFGVDNTFAYCQKDDDIVAYNVVTEEIVKLLHCKKDHYYTATQDLDGTIQLKVWGDYDEFYIIKNGAIVEGPNDAPCYVEYELNGKHYYTDRETIYCQGIDMSDELSSANFRAIVPYRDGLLLMNEGYGKLLYYIQNDGTVQLLFPEFPCMCSTSSVNFYEDYIFLSFMRWEGYGDIQINLKAYDNDAVKGTYRIDMRDNSIIKISDETYNGMFILDDTSIFACNRNGDIHQLDFEGNIKQIIVD